MNRQKITALLLIAAIVSFAGFCVENIFISMTLGYIDNRNMHLPFLLGYGLGVVTLFCLFGTPQQPRLLGKPIVIANKYLRVAIYYLTVCLGVTACEIALGTFVEKVFDIIWWEYTTLPLCIARYSSAPTSMGFGALITAFMGWIFPPLYRKFSQAVKKAPAITAWTLMLLMTWDFIFSMAQMYATGNFIRIWRIDF